MFKDTYSLDLKQKYIDLFVQGMSPGVISKVLNIDYLDSRKLSLILKLVCKKNYEDLPGEKWVSLDIIGYPLYFVSNKGRVRRLNRLKKLRINDSGYLQINLYNLNKMVTRTVHRLVMLAFVGDSCLTVNHKDYNKLNNDLSNLEYMSSGDNVRYNYLDDDYTKRASARVSGTSNPMSKLTEKDVLFILDKNNISKTNRELGLMFGVESECIRRIRKRERWKHINISGSTTSRKTYHSSEVSVTEFGEIE